jgi:murein DD-endopeptidase MepM/ murein hydrolase activator NlpD
MVAESSGQGSWFFPEIRIDLRTGNRSSQILLTPIVQIAAASAVIIGAAALFYLGVSWIRSARTMAEQEAAVVRTETANVDLQDEIASLRDKLALALRSREQAERQLSALAAQTDSLRGIISNGQVHPPTAGSEETAGGKIAQLTQALDQSRRELHQTEAQRATLASRLSKIEADQSETPARQQRAACDAVARKLQQVIVDRDRAIGERDRLKARIAELEPKHSEREFLRPEKWAGAYRLAGLILGEVAQLEANFSRPEVLITDAPPTPRQNTGTVAELGRRAVSEFARVLASTGLNVARLFPQFDFGRGEGGPFVPPPRAGQPGEISPDKLEAMRSLIKSLPLSAPLDQYQLESRFGPRRDPFNHKTSYHTGIDLSAPYMSPVYATAPGVVTYAGYRADYGKVVEISHGNGIATVYGHLHRYIVAVGQPVAEHEQIGFLGSTGRSSGPHVHYEILVNDEPQDPEKFLGLARVIPAANR